MIVGILVEFGILAVFAGLMAWLVWNLQIDGVKLYYVPEAA